MRRWTLTTTRSPDRRVAACTWAIDAEATGSAVEGDEDLGEGTPEILLDGAADRREGLGRDPVAQQAELVDQLLGEDALARGDDLAELDVGRARGARRPAADAGRARPATARCRGRGPPR